MANRLAMDKAQAIKGLEAAGLSERQIASTLEVSRKAVRRHLGRISSKDTKAPTGSSAHRVEGSKDTKAPTGSEVLPEVPESPPAETSRSLCQAYREAILAKLEAQHPDADTELHYRNAFELLVATILSAQSTDQRVNIVTPALFAKYPDARALSVAEPADVERLVLQTGFFRQKTKALIGMSLALVEKHGGEVPASIDALVQLPGVGRKTANVVLGHALGVPGLPVDRHVLRVANRIGLVESDDPEEIESQLCRLLPKERWTLASDLLILHGRRICRPAPLCDRCAVRDDCLFLREVERERGRATAGGRTATRRRKAAGGRRAARKVRKPRR